MTVAFVMLANIIELIIQIRLLFLFEFFSKIIIILRVLPVWTMCMHCLWSPEEGVRSLELELKAVMTWELNLGSLNYPAISPAPLF